MTTLHNSPPFDNELPRLPNQSFPTEPIIDRPGNLARWDTKTRGHCTDRCGFMGIVRWGLKAGFVRTECESYQHRDGARRKVGKQLRHLAGIFEELDRVWVGWYLELPTSKRTKRVSHRVTNQRSRVSTPMDPAGSVTVHRHEGASLILASHDLTVTGVLGGHWLDPLDAFELAWSHMEAPGLRRLNYGGAWSGLTEGHGGEKVIGGDLVSMSDLVEELKRRGVSVSVVDGYLDAWGSGLSSEAFQAVLEDASEAVKVAKIGPREG